MNKIFITGPKAKQSEKDLFKGIDVINTTSLVKSSLSPFYLRNIPLYGDHSSKTMENAWQYAKVYPVFIENGILNKEKYFAWALEGWNNYWAVRYPMGKGIRPAYSYWDGEALNYIEARKKIYIPLYAKAVVKTLAFQALVERYARQDIVLWDYDGYHTEGTLKEVLNDGSKNMGHAFVLAMLLKDEIGITGDLVYFKEEK